MSPNRLTMPIRTTKPIADVADNRAPRRTAGRASAAAGACPAATTGVLLLLIRHPRSDRTHRPQRVGPPSLALAAGGGCAGCSSCAGPRRAGAPRCARRVFPGVTDGVGHGFPFQVWVEHFPLAAQVRLRADPGPALVVGPLRHLPS